MLALPAASKWMFGCDECCPGLVGAVGEEASARLSERWRAHALAAHLSAETLTENSEGLPLPLRRLRRANDGSLF